jgi:hypothetical protein
MRGLMRSLHACLLALCTLTACGRTDVVLAPGSPIVEREVELDDGDLVWVEVHAGDDMDVRASFLAVEDGVTLDDLVDAIALGEPAQLILDTRDAEPVLIVRVEEDPRAYIWR